MTDTNEQPVTGALAVPDGWEPVDDVDQPGVELVVREPASDDRPGGFRASLVVTRAEALDVTFAEWQNANDEILADTCADYVPIDLERLWMSGNEGGRRLAHYASDDGRALTVEQWFVLIDGDGHTLTFTVDTPRYDAWADAITEIAESWVPVLPKEDSDA